jgi:hypothetical protein
MGFAQNYWVKSVSINVAYLLLGLSFFLTGRYGAKFENVPLVWGMNNIHVNIFSCNIILFHSFFWVVGEEE